MVRPDSPTPDGDPEVLPQLTSGVNIRELPIGPEEAFVLSRVDGSSSPADIAAATNFAPSDVARMLARLASLGAITFGAARPASGTPPVRPNPARSGAYRIGPVTETQEPRASHHPAAVDESAAAVAEPAELVDLTLEQQRDLSALHERLSTADHYQLLGVEPQADGKAIRAAYYDFVRLFHPDRFFGKKLGRYKPKLTQVFARLTEAYETLNRSQTRSEYDRYLSARRRTLDFERQFLDPNAQAAEVAIAMQRIEHAARAEALAAQPPPSASPASSAPPPSSAAPISASVPSGTSRTPPSLAPESDANLRRRALARKLGHSSVPPRGASSPPPSGPASAADELKRRYESRLLRARQEQRDHYLTLSEQAAARGELAAAANALRIACSLAPDDAMLADRLAELQNRASAELWEAYAERGKYAAFEGRHAEAAESFERAAAGQPIASHFERAAFHLLEAGGDARHAVQLARQAVALAPQSGKCRLTLAQAYFAGKLRESGLAELERARALEPDQPQIKEWLQRAKRGEI